MTLKAAPTMIFIKLKGYQKQLHMEMPHSLRKCELCNMLPFLFWLPYTLFLTESASLNLLADKQQGVLEPFGIRTGRAVYIMVDCAEHLTRHRGEAGPGSVWGPQGFRDSVSSPSGPQGLRDSVSSPSYSHQMVLHFQF